VPDRSVAGKSRAGLFQRCLIHFWLFSKTILGMGRHHTLEKCAPPVLGNVALLSWRDRLDDGD